MLHNAWRPIRPRQVGPQRYERASSGTSSRSRHGTVHHCNGNDVKLEKLETSLHHLTLKFRWRNEIPTSWWHSECEVLWETIPLLEAVAKHTLHLVQPKQLLCGVFMTSKPATLRERKFVFVWTREENWDHSPPMTNPPLGVLPLWQKEAAREKRSRRHKAQYPAATKNVHSVKAEKHTQLCYSAFI